MKKPLKKAAKKRVTVASLLARIVRLESRLDDFNTSFGRLRNEIQYGNTQLSELPSIRKQASDACEEIQSIRELVRRKYQMDVDAGVAEELAQQLREKANRAASKADEVGAPE